MELKNRTAFVFAPMMGRVNFPAHTASLIVKAGFRIVNGGVITPLDPQPSLDGDVLAGPEASYEADLGLFKPNAEVLLTGTCYTPGGKAQQTCPVTFKVGGWSKTIAAIGNRVWQKSLLSAKASEPELFNKLALTWANAFGGAAFKDNPAGKGHKDDLLPNLEQMNKLIKGRGDKPDPANFGPILRTWPQRAGKMGTYDKKWLKERFPAQAADFDWTYYNAAPPDQQLKGFLRGDEEIELTNMHPEHSVLKTRLPGLRIRLLLREGPEGAPVEKLTVREVPLNLDTLHVNADKGELYLLWRGIGNVSEQDWPECRDILVVAEPLSEKPQTIEQLLPQFIDPVDPLDSEEGEEPEEEPESPAQWQAKFDKEMAGAEAGMEKQDPGAQLRAADLLKRAGVTPNPSPQPVAPKPGFPMIRELLKKSGVPMPATIAAAGAGEAAMYADPFIQKALTSLIAPGAAGQAAAKPDGKATAAMMRTGEAKGGDFSGADLSNQNLKGADLSECFFQGTNFAGADLTGAKLYESLLTDANLTGAKLAGADLSETDLTRANFTNADLAGAKLHDATLENAILTGAKCAMANFDGATLLGVKAEKTGFQGANLKDCAFSNGIVTGADFTEANLTDAAMDGVSGAGAKFDKAKLSGFRGGEKSDFSGASFLAAEATGAVFERTNLKNADFRGATLTRAQFQYSDLTGANLFGCDMAEAMFHKTILREAKAGNANFLRAQLDAADMENGSFIASNFYEAEFLDAKTAHADFAGANLRMTKLGKA